MTETVRILFVDDEPNILSGLKRLMRNMRDQWDMSFCSSAPEALAAFEKAPFDVIVSDMRMPGMEGAQLLELVREKYPGTIRVILSGYADSESVLRTVGPAHIYLAKPCDPQLLQEAIVRPLSLRAYLNSHELRTLLAGLNNLPSLPDVFVRLSSELLFENSSAASVSEIIASDLAMTAEVLRLTNSAYFSTAMKVTTPLQAVRTLGTEIIQSLVLRIGIFRQFQGSSAVGALLKRVNEYSMKVSKLAELIAKTEGVDHALVTQALCTGMLSPIGILVLLDAKGGDYRKIIEESTSHEDLCQRETAHYGVNNHLIGAYLLSLWGFSEDIIEAVAMSPNPSQTQGNENFVLTALHAALSLGPHFLILKEGASDVQELLDMEYLKRVGRDDRIPVWRELAETINERK